MDVLKKFGAYCLDFLFPKSASIEHLESLSSGDLTNLLSPARDVNDDRLIVLFSYADESVRQMIWELKYKGNRTIGKKFGEILVDVLEHELAERKLFENFIDPLLAPMPISDKRRRERGWNQTEILGEEMQKLNTENLFIYEPHSLIKHAHTDSQARTHATKREREANLYESIRADEKVVRGRCVIVLDDVTTSGATFAEAKRALKLAGAKKILFLAVAH